jgi:hypothetical protein
VTNMSVKEEFGIQNFSCFWLRGPMSQISHVCHIRANDIFVFKFIFKLVVDIEVA